MTFLWLTRSLRLSPFLLMFLGATTLVGAAEHDQPFRRALPGYEFRFPADHAAHPDFRTEWWYYTGHLSTAQGRTFGFQLTFFRHALRRPDEVRRSRWALHTLYFAHLAVTDEEGGSFRFQEKVSRGSLGLAGAETSRYVVWVEDWSARLEGQSHRLTAGREEMGLDLTLVPSKKPVIHGRDGVSQKAEGEGYASHYYSITRLALSGTLAWQGRSYPVTGEAWMDHEFGSNQLRDYQVGWDWFSVQLDGGVELMLYLIRHRDGRIDSTSSGTLVRPNGAAEHLALGAFQVEVLGSWRSKKSGVTYPSGWRLKVPQYELDLTLTPTLPDQELTTRKSTLVNYWEGSVRITGTVAGTPAAGRGYVELTGYDKEFKPDI
jgi:predicted secreted hydrolase